MERNKPSRTILVDKAVGSKIMTAAQAVELYVHNGATVGIGGQTTGRCSMALTHEVLRQQKRDLTLVGCSMSISMDMMVGASLVKRTECGTGNLERYGTTFQWRRSVENGTVEVEDYSHLAMALRFLAGSLGLPFMPTKSLLGTDILNKKSFKTHKPFELIDNPWNTNEPVVLLPALSPDVSLIHAQKADELGNVIIEGFTTHEPEMAKASKSVIVSCEELVSSDNIRRDPDRTTIPYIFVDAVVVQPFGAYPTSVYKYYEHDEAYILSYQEAARMDGNLYKTFMQKNVYDFAKYDGFLNQIVGEKQLKRLSESMTTILEDSHR